MTAPPAVPQLQIVPGIAIAEDGLVVLDGPNGLALTMTSEAAAETGLSLIAAAEIAQRQMADKKKGEEG